MMLLKSLRIKELLKREEFDDEIIEYVEAGYKKRMGGDEDYEW